mmetsp:Transcript_3354/g.9302  ORF Transcript_3354/g.9302 Transcript_3354/m.9302 type:complete len:346 (-) Transcript_3354:1088-2125(-)
MRLRSLLRSNSRGRRSHIDLPQAGQQRVRTWIVVLQLLPIEGVPLVVLDCFVEAPQKSHREFCKVFHRVGGRVRPGRRFGPPSTWSARPVVLDAVIESLLHGALVALADVLVVVSIAQHAVVVRVAQLVEHDAADSPEVAVFLVPGSIVDLNALVLVSRETVLEKPSPAGMVAAPASFFGAVGGTPRQAAIDPDGAVLLQIVPGMGREEFCRGANVSFQLFCRNGVPTAPVGFQAAGPSAKGDFLVDLGGRVVRLGSGLDPSNHRAPSVRIQARKIVVVVVVVVAVVAVLGLIFVQRCSSLSSQTPRQGPKTSPLGLGGSATKKLLVCRFVRDRYQLDSSRQDRR